MKFLESLFNFLLVVSRVRDESLFQRADTENRKKYCRLGLTSIVFSVCAVASAAVGGLLLKFASDGGIVLLVLCGLFGLAFIIAALVYLVHALVRLIFQFKVNKNAASWIALVVFVLSIPGAALAALLLIGLM